MAASVGDRFALKIESRLLPSWEGVFQKPKSKTEMRRLETGESGLSASVVRSSPERKQDATQIAIDVHFD
jgi:hypothetical protein